MIVDSKIVIPNKEWIIIHDNKKIGTISKTKKGFNFLNSGKKIFIKNSDEIKNIFGITLPVQLLNNKIINNYFVHDYPCSSVPHNSTFNILKKLPLFSKSSKSKSRYCAGYYIIKFKKGWVKSYCPKLITLERNDYHGPFKSELEMRKKLNIVNKNETT